MVRGQLIGAPMKGQPAATVLVKLPLRLGRPTISPPCFATHGAIPAGCKAPCWAYTPLPPHCRSPYPYRGNTITVPTYVGRYPPLYYALVGWPSLLFPNLVGVHLMRLASDALDSIFLGLAIAVAMCFGSTRLWAAGLGVTITPTVMSLIAVINPSGLEISASIAAWTSGLILIWDSPGAISPTLVRATGASAAVLGLTRAPSPLWVAIMGVFLVVMASRNRRHQLIRSPIVRRYVYLVVAACTLSLGWTVLARATAITSVAPKPPAAASFIQVFALAAEHVGSIVNEMIGVTGWLDGFMPSFVYLIWIGAVGAIFFYAWAMADLRHRLGMLVALLASFLVPTAMIVSHARTDGIFMQGRDALPLTVSVPLVAMAALAAAQRSKRREPMGPEAAGAVTRAVLYGTALANIISFAAFYRRFAVGLNGPFDFFLHVKNGWQPAIFGPLLMAWFALASIAVARWLAPSQSNSEKTLDTGASPWTSLQRHSTPGNRRSRLH